MLYAAGLIWALFIGAIIGFFLSGACRIASENKSDDQIHGIENRESDAGQIQLKKHNFE